MFPIHDAGPGSGGMVDRPRDKQQRERSGRSEGEAAILPEPEGELSGRDVIRYLRQHPDFLADHPEALRLLRTPSRPLGEGVFDFQHFHIERLRQDFTRLTIEHRNLIAASRATLASQGRVHKAVLAVLAAPSFEQLLQIVTTDLAVLLDVDIVTIAVESNAMPAGRLSLHGIHLLKAGTVDTLLGGDRQALLRAETPGETILFGSAAGLVRSHALLRLGFGRGGPIGLLCIGTRQPRRFHPGLPTEQLTFLARTIGIAISQWLNPRS